MSICSACEHNSVFHFPGDGCQARGCSCHLERHDREFREGWDERGRLRPEYLYDKYLGARNDLREAQALEAEEREARDMRANVERPEV